jgi:Zn-dependent metalloprotease
MKSKNIQLIYFSAAMAAIVLLSVLPGSVSAQNPTRPLHRKLEALAKPQSNRNWLEFREGTSINPSTIFTDLKDAFELSANDQMKIKKAAKDELGFTNYRYQQYYKGIKVLYGEYMVHQQRNGFVKSANGQLINGLNNGNTPSVSEKQALAAGMAFMKAKKFLWQNDELEKDLKRQQKNQNATYFPKGELVYAPGSKSNNDDLNAADYKLTWNFKIYTDDPDVTAKSVYVDAVTGRVIHYADIAMNCAGGSGNSAFNGSVSFNTELSGGSYRSHNDCQATDIYVFNCNGGAASNTYYTDADNVWTLASQQSAVQAQWGAVMTYNYYSGQHSRASWDNASGNMIAYNNAYAGSNNACWGCTGNSTIYYAGNTSAATDDWNPNDIMGHEFTHGVTQSEANLVYSYESGALNESFSDIFGEMVESWSEGNCDYLVGGDRGAIRSLSNPNAYGDPDTYLGSFWYTGTGDNGGVHTNSGVQNYWFYLLSEGGSGTNDFGISYNVTGITRFKARMIAYRALTQYLTSSSRYIDARRATLQAAWDLYGQCSPEIIAVGNAWHAVGVESQSAQYVRNICGSYPASGTFLQAISVITAANGCITQITPSSSTVYFTARDRVVLYPGFTAASGSKFVAYLEPCSSTMWIDGGPSTEITMSDPEKGIFNRQSQRSFEKAAETPVPITSTTISVNPNPFHANFDLSINSKQNAKAQVAIFNSVGVKVKERQGVNLIKGFNKISFNGSDLQKGVYMMEVVIGNEITVKKIVKM